MDLEPFAQRRFLALAGVVGSAEDIDTMSQSTAIHFHGVRLPNKIDGLLIHPMYQA